jgi:hypothetical protein
MRTDLRVWVDQLATNAEWEPWLFEFAFGLPGQPGHDPESLEGSGDDRRPVHSSWVDRSRRAQTRDDDSARHRSQDGEEPIFEELFIGGGAQLQPIIYSLAVEEATNGTVESGPLLVLHDARRFHRSRRPHQRADAADGH